MTWVRKQALTRHRCPCPTPVDSYDLGDLWACDTCNRLWRVGKHYTATAWYGYEWHPAYWWQRLVHRRKAETP